MSLSIFFKNKTLRKHIEPRFYTFLAMHKMSENKDDFQVVFQFPYLLDFFCSNNLVIDIDGNKNYY